MKVQLFMKYMRNTGAGEAGSAKGRTHKGALAAIMCLCVVLTMFVCSSCSGLGGSTGGDSSTLPRNQYYAVDTSKEKPSVEEQREALIACIDAFMAHGEDTFFTTLMKDDSITPEDATSTNNAYTTCSAMVHQVYLQTFGINLPSKSDGFFDYADEHLSGDEVPIYYLGAENIMVDGVMGADEFDEEGFLHLCAQTLEVGDIVSILHRDGSGHVMIVYSIDRDTDEVIVSEAVGQGYQFADDVNHTMYLADEPYGTVGIESKFGYYYRHDDIVGFAALRLINEDCSFGSFDGQSLEYRLTDAAEARLAYPDIYIEKNAAVTCDGVDRGGASFASLGDEITYTVSITNSSSATYTTPIAVSETVPEGLTVTQAGDASKTGRTLSWEIDALSPGQTVQLTYTTQVDAEATLGTLCVAQGNVAGIQSSRIETRIVRSLTSSEKQSVLTAFHDLEDTDETERDFLNSVYAQALGVDLGISNALGNRDIITLSSEEWPEQENGISVKYTEFVQSVPENVRASVLGNCYGLAIQRKANAKKDYAKRNNWNTDLNEKYESDDRARSLAHFTVTEDYTVDDYTINLDDGDILLTYSTNAGTLDERVNQAYIFFRDDENPRGALYRKTAANEFVTLTGTEMTQYLLNLVAGDNYLVLRPAQLLDR